MSTTLRLLALVEKPLDRSPSQRFRIEQWAPLLAAHHGMTVHFAPFESDRLADLMDRPGRRWRKFALAAAATRRRWSRRDDVRAYDGVIITRSASLLGGAWFERYLNRIGLPYVFDFDDAIWEPAPGWTRHLWRSHARVPESIRRAAAVAAGNDYLAQYARRHTDRVHVVPTSIDLTQYTPLPRAPETGAFRILWMGSAATLRHLDALLPALRQLASRRALELRVVYNGPPRTHSGLTARYTAWSPRVELEALAESHVGIMPLTDTPFARGKCGLKALQYMAAERATVVSPVGVNRDIVRDGENGLWATSDAEWVAQLDRLAADPALRARLAENGRRTVEQGYSATIAAARFASVVRSALRPERMSA